ncbi:hypothetical protein MRX96_004453 [Rhipicephalus microplus]
MYDPESPTGSPVTVVQSVNGDSESSTNEDSKGLDKEEDDEVEPNLVAATKAARSMTRPCIKGARLLRRLYRRTTAMDKRHHVS